MRPLLPVARRREGLWARRTRFAVEASQKGEG
jgi:hypothetical protein